MADPQVPANAVQEAQAILQNPAPDEAQAPAQQAQAQPQAPAQADEVSLEVSKLYFFSCSLPHVSFRFSSVWFVLVPRFCFVLCAWLSRLPLLMWALRAIL